MTKDELVIATSAKGTYTQATVRHIIGDLVDTIREELKKGNEVRLAGLGVFKIAHRAETKAHNIHTGGEMIIPARKVLAFKPFRSVRDEINT